MIGFSAGNLTKCERYWFKSTEISPNINRFPCHEEIEKVILFGFCVKGTFKQNSDIDIVVDDIYDDLQIEFLALELDELPLPYKFDVKSIVGICNIDLKKNIDRVGIVIYLEKIKPYTNKVGVILVTKMRSKC